METQNKIMSYDEAEHFYAWLEKTVHITEQHETEEAIHAVLRLHPSLISEGYSWPEIRRMAEVTA
jgi:hypothetical protein